MKQFRFAFRRSYDYHYSNYPYSLRYQPSRYPQRTRYIVKLPSVRGTDCVVDYMADRLRVPTFRALRHDRSEVVDCHNLASARAIAEGRALREKPHSPIRPCRSYLHGSVLRRDTRWFTGYVWTLPTPQPPVTTHVTEFPQNSLLPRTSQISNSRRPYDYYTF